MSLGLRLASLSRWKLGALASLFGATLAALAYQLPASLELDLGGGLASALVTEGFHDAEAGYRWTRAQSEILFPDPGARGDARLEIQLSGFRPRGEEAPLLVVDAGGESLRVHPSRRIEPYALVTRTEGIWSSSLHVALRAETFTPGGGDDRALGVRVHRVRLELGPGAFPPLRQLVGTGALVLFVFLGLAERRAPARAFAAAVALSAAVALGYGVSRLQTALAVPPLAGIAGVVAGLRLAAPSFAAFAAEALARAFRSGAAAFRGVARGGIFAGAVATTGLVAATLLVPRFDLDVGSGEAAPLLERFGAADADAAGVRFREALDGAALDLRDFGWGSPWRVNVDARLGAGGPARGTVARLGDTEIVGALGDGWGSSRAAAPAPRFGWRPAYVLEFGDLGAGRRLQLAAVRVDRGRSLPSPRTLALLLAATFALLLAFRAAGLSVRASAAAAATGSALVALGVALAPVVVTPFVADVALGAGAGAVLAASTRGALDALAARRLAPPLAPAALAVAVAAFVLWFVASASPLYVGGHFAYHSSVAEEIWRGRFLLYYLPGPDNMLARQPQWGNLVVPHPCLFHTLAAPLAALPTAAFHLATKLFLAALLFGIALVSGLVASEIGGERAGIAAVTVVALSPIGFQLLGLGHLMTILGCWAAAVALGFLVLHVHRLSERRFFVGAVALVALCCLSYTGSLLFGSVSLLLAAALLLRDDRAAAWRLAAVVALAWGVALLLYYGNWVVPFLTESVPTLLAGSSSRGATDFGARIAAEPRKLGYTFGSFLVPVAGLCGLSLARGRRRLLLVAWASVLVVFSLLDVGFNFLLKHHYFTLPAVAVGVALASDRLARKGPWATWILLVLLVLLGWLGLREALATALGGA
jgi:hypothetical protein